MMAWLVCAVLAAGEFASTAFAQSSPRDQALALEEHGQFAEAEQAWRAIAQADPKSAEAYAHLGLIAAREQRFDEAISFYIQAYPLNPDFPELQMNLGLALFKGGHFKESIQPFTNELRKHPGDQRLTILLGMTHYSMSDYLVAIPYLKRAAAAYPQNVPMRLALARSCLWSRQFACVLEVDRQIVALHAESAESDMLAGEALDQTGDGAAAIQRFRSAVQADPKQAFAHFGLGYLLWEQREFDEAAREFQAELANDPQQTVARVYLADCYLQLNDRVKAQAEVEKLLAANAAPAIAYRDAGIVYAAVGRDKDALEDLLKAIALDAQDADTHQQLAKLYQSMGERVEAKKELAAANAAATGRSPRPSLSEVIADAQARP
jgi:tetratricopeptide (TPR) repeat protein